MKAQTAELFHLLIQTGGTSPELIAIDDRRPIADAR
jgi:hypothetical protein